MGAGMAGLCTAALCLDDGASVAVIEAGTSGGRTTGHSTAKLTALHGNGHGVGDDHQRPNRGPRNPLSRDIRRHQGLASRRQRPRAQHCQGRVAVRRRSDLRAARRRSRWGRRRPRGRPRACRAS
ncbi:MAG: FAD-dependent oxidoreductase [Acidimicrobiia bacterium]